MIAADTSSLIAYFEGDKATDTALIEQALANGELCIAPVVLMELLSDPGSRSRLEQIISGWTQLEITAGYWIRASRTRAKLIGLRLTAKVPDALIAQSAIDHDVPLITRDSDFKHFAKHCGLKLA